MKMIVLECLCGNSRALYEEELKRHPSASIACGGLIEGGFCQLQYDATDLLDHADHRGVYWARAHVEKKQTALGFSSGPS